MKKLLTVIVITLSFFCQVNAQNTDLYKIYLKSGLVLKAELVKVIPDSIIQIKQYGMLTVLKFNAIDSVVFSESRLPDFQMAFMKQKIKRSNILDSGWSLGLQPGFSIGFTEWDITSSFIFRASVLKNNGKHLMYGFNFGLEPYSYYEQAFGVADLEGRYYFRANTNRSMFFGSLMGYGFNITSPALGRDGGFNFFAGLGQSFKTRNNVLFSFAFGYKYQSYQVMRNIWQVGNVLTYNRLNRFETKFEWRF